MYGSSLGAPLCSDDPHNQALVGAQGRPGEYANYIPCGDPAPKLSDHALLVLLGALPGFDKLPSKYGRDNWAGFDLDYTNIS